jgi:hypothetical protein
MCNTVPAQAFLDDVTKKRRAMGCVRLIAYHRVFAARHPTRAGSLFSWKKLIGTSDR